MQSPEKFREYAQECMRIAKQMSPENKATLLEIAQAWMRCAEEAERKLGQSSEDETKR